MGPLLVVLLVSLQAGSFSGGLRSPAAAPVPRDANLYYVDPVRGRDLGNGRNPEQPWRTLTHAIPRAGGSPAVIVLAPGEYSEASGERFPLRPQMFTYLWGGLDVTASHGVRILGPRGERAVPVLEFTAGFQRFERLEIATDGVAFDVTYARSFPSDDVGSPDVGIDAVIQARRAVDAHLEAGTSSASLRLAGSIACDEAVVTLDGTWSPPPSDVFDLRLGGPALSAGPRAAVVDLRAGGRGRVAVSCSTAALHASGAGLWLRPRDPLDVRVQLEACVLHALGNATFGGGPLVAQGTGALEVVIRRSIFWQNHLDLDLAGYDPATYVLERNLVQQPSLVGIGGSFGGDPRFVDAAAGDYHLRPDSPARGAGLAGPGGRDHERDPRGSGPDDATTDVGLDEFYPRYHWFHPRPRFGTSVRVRILGTPGDLALVFAGRLQSGGPFGVGSGWQLGELLAPKPIAVALVGPDGLAEATLSLPRALGDGRLPPRGILTQVRYLTPQGGTEISANALLVDLLR